MPDKKKPLTAAERKELATRFFVLTDHSDPVQQAKLGSAVRAALKHPLPDAVGAMRTAALLGTERQFTGTEPQPVWEGPAWVPPGEVWFARDLSRMGRYPFEPSELGPELMARFLKHQGLDLRGIVVRTTVGSGLRGVEVVGAGTHRLAVAAILRLPALPVVLRVHRRDAARGAAELREMVERDRAERRRREPRIGGMRW